jgi:hypothetical protein
MSTESFIGVSIDLSGMIPDRRQRATTTASTDEHGHGTN